MIDLSRILEIKDDQIGEMENTIASIKKQDAAKKAYKAIKGDIVDEMLARYINSAGV